MILHKISFFFQVSHQRLLSFIKRLTSLCLQLHHHGVLSVLASIRSLIQVRCSSFQQHIKQITWWLTMILELHHDMFLLDWYQKWNTVWYRVARQWCLLRIFRRPWTCQCIQYGVVWVALSEGKFCHRFKTLVPDRIYIIGKWIDHLQNHTKQP